jgi:hypothetical protein
MNSETRIGRAGVSVSDRWTASVIGFGWAKPSSEGYEYAQQQICQGNGSHAIRRFGADRPCTLLRRRVTDFAQSSVH